MYREKGLGIIAIIIIIIIIIILVASTTIFINKYIDKEKDIDIIQNMLSIQGACRVLKQDSIVQKNTDMFVGTKISDMPDDNLINEFKGKNIINESEYEKYYCLNNENLEQLNLEIENEENAYYLINYDDDEVIITNSYKGKYKLSEFNNESDENGDVNDAGDINEDTEENNGEENNGEENNSEGSNSGQ